MESSHFGGFTNQFKPGSQVLCVSVGKDLKLLPIYRSKLTFFKRFSTFGQTLFMTRNFQANLSPDLAVKWYVGKR